MAKVLAQGSTLSYSADGGTSYTTISNITGFQEPEPGTNYVDVSTLDQAGNLVDELPGLQAAANFTFDIIFDPADATHQAVKGLVGDGNIYKFKLTLGNTAKSLQFDGYVESMPLSGAVNAPITTTLTIRLSTGVTLV